MRSRCLLPVLSVLTLAALIAPAVVAFAGDEIDLLRPYGTRSQPAAKARRYPTRSVTPPISLERSAHNALRHDYFPGLRSGQGPNHNVTGPLCVPGRRAFLGVVR